MQIDKHISESKHWKLTSSLTNKLAIILSIISLLDEGEQPKKCKYKTQVLQNFSPQTLAHLQIRFWKPISVACPESDGLFW